MRSTPERSEVTAGNFFKQFSQLIFRSYEERYLGVDNAMEGVRVKYQPYPGSSLKGGRSGASVSVSIMDL